MTGSGHADPESAVVSRTETSSVGRAAIDPVTHVRDVAEYLEAMQQTRRDEQVPEPFVIETKRLVSTKGRRACATVNNDIQDRAVRAPYELGLAATQASMQSPDDSAVGARLGILSERRTVNAVQWRRWRASNVRVKQPRSS